MQCDSVDSYPADLRNSGGPPYCVTKRSGIFDQNQQPTAAVPRRGLEEKLPGGRANCRRRNAI